MFYTIEDFNIIKSMLRNAKQILFLNQDETNTINELLQAKVINGGFVTQQELIIVYKCMLVNRDLFGETPEITELRKRTRKRL